MAEIAHAWATRTSHTYGSGSSWTYATAFVTYAAATADCPIVTDGVYLIIAKALVTGSSNSNLFHFRLSIDDGSPNTAFTDSEMIFEPGAAGNPNYHTYGYMTKWTATGAYALQLEGYSEGGEVCYCDEAAIIVIKLSDDLVAETDYVYNEDTTDRQHTVAYQQFAHDTLPTGTSDDWLVIGSYSYDVNEAGKRIVDYYLYHDEAQKTRTRMLGNTTEEQHCHMTMAMFSTSGGSHTVSVRGRDESESGTANVHLRSAVFAIRSGAFDASYGEFNAAIRSYTAVDTEETVLGSSSNFTAASTSSHLVLGCAAQGMTRTAKQYGLGLEVDGTDVMAGEPTHYACYVLSRYDSCGTLSIGLVDMSAGTRTVLLRGVGSYAGIGTGAASRSFCVLSMNLSGGAGPQTLEPSALSVSAAPVAPTLPAEGTSLSTSAITVSSSPQATLERLGAVDLSAAALSVTAAPQATTEVLHQRVSAAALAVSAAPVAATLPAETTVYTPGVLAVSATPQSGTVNVSGTSIEPGALAVSAAPQTTDLPAEGKLYSTNALAVTASPQASDAIIGLLTPTINALAVTAAPQAADLGTADISMSITALSVTAAPQHTELEAEAAPRTLFAGALAISASPVAPTLPTEGVQFAASALAVTAAPQSAEDIPGISTPSLNALAVSAGPQGTDLPAEATLYTPSVISVSASPQSGEANVGTSTPSLSALAITAGAQTATLVMHTTLTTSAITVSATATAVTLGRETLVLTPAAEAVTVTLGAPRINQQLRPNAISVGVTLQAPVSGLGTSSITVASLAVTILQPTLAISGPGALQWTFPDATPGDDGGLIWRVDPDEYPSGVTFIFECVIMSGSVSWTTYCRLYNATTGQPVDGSEVSTNATTRQFLQSSEFSLPSGQADYRAQIGNIVNQVGYWYAAEVEASHD